MESRCWSAPPPGGNAPLSSPTSPLTPVGPTITCTVTSTQYPPAVPQAQQQVTLQAAAGLESVYDIQATNGAVSVPAYTPGTTNPVVITATKSTAGVGTSWSFYASDINGQVKYCE
jgi:hypothetical protein